MMCLINCVLLTSPSLGLMFVSWITSRWADWETRGSEESEMMWSQTPERVLHYEEKIKCHNKYTITIYYLTYNLKHHILKEIRLGKKNRGKYSCYSVKTKDHVGCSHALLE